MTASDYALAFLKAFTLTQASELPVVWFLLKRHARHTGGELSSRRVLATALLANMLTLPYLWFVYPEYVSYRGSVVLGELTALVAEAVVYRLALGLTFPKALQVSLMANLCSVLIGLGVG